MDYIDILDASTGPKKKNAKIDVDLNLSAIEKKLINGPYIHHMSEIYGEYSEVLEEDNLTNDTLLNAINDLYDNREQYIKTMQSSTLNDAINIIMNLIEETISTN